MALDRVGYHKEYYLSADNNLIEAAAANIPVKGTVARQLADLKRRQVALNERLGAPRFRDTLKDASPALAGIYPLKVTEFRCSCECNDEDGMCEQLTARLGNLKVITEVPFMRKGNLIFAIRSQGLVDPATGDAESVDSLFNGGIYWKGRLDERAYDYELLMFRSEKDQCVGTMTESIDLTRRLSGIDPGVYQSEVAYHLEMESNDASGRPTLGRSLLDYGLPEELEQVAQCYAASAAFSAAVARGGTNLGELADAARRACAAVPGKRYYQAYDAFLQGIAYNPK